MKLSKIDLTNILAIGHSNGQLGLLIDRGEDVEYIEISAPAAAYNGLQQVHYIANNEISAFPPNLETPEEIESSQSIAMLPVSSSMANGIGYDEERKVLQVEFKNGSVYQYSEVESETWESFQSADSVGQFFNAEIRGSYYSERIDEVNMIATGTLDCSNFEEDCPD
ncbi:KTSC domain-containing protein [Microcoleus sp. FACHB-68]|uniref:KTSC domain-containing protein n=1 Tax=Microcoleus sp. FACHB-68 TaxID=2692826 RepID=UPI0016836E0C|nr:KTSC domain-containing protein [Microcoleus sp. FACHB-68]MBD1936699.1 KTSC domain-containing protein [Microcoleus sp. FACHB-68]